MDDCMAIWVTSRNISTERCNVWPEQEWTSQHGAHIVPLSPFFHVLSPSCVFILQWSSKGRCERPFWRQWSISGWLAWAVFCGGRQWKRAIAESPTHLHTAVITGIVPEDAGTVSQPHGRGPIAQMKIEACSDRFIRFSQNYHVIECVWMVSVPSVEHQTHFIFCVGS